MTSWGSEKMSHVPKIGHCPNSAINWNFLSIIDDMALILGRIIH